MASDEIDEWFLSNIESIKRVVLSMVERAGTRQELETIRSQRAPEAFERVAATFKERLRQEADARIADARREVTEAIEVKATRLAR